MRFLVKMHVLSPQSVPVEFCIESESRVKCMKIIWDEKIGFILDDKEIHSVSQCLGCKYCKPSLASH